MFEYIKNYSKVHHMITDPHGKKEVSQKHSFKQTLGAVIIAAAAGAAISSMRKKFMHH